MHNRPHRRVYSMKRNIFLLTFLFTWALNANAGQIPNTSLEFVNACRTNLDCELSLFQELSKLLRPSKEEGPAADYILQLKSVAEKNIWKKVLPSSQDKIGNLVIEVPATGKFKGRNFPSIAIQSHTDMVLAHKLAKPGEDLRPYFKDGVRLAFTGDLIHSKDRQTTIGADNGIGVAMALRYLLDPTLAHPPLELVFTVREEIGLAGALAMEVPLKSRQLINLDGMSYDPRTIITASQGASRSIGNGLMPTELEASNSTRIRVSLSHLSGGHSGGDIHLKRLNSVRGAAHILSHLQSQFKDLKIVSVIAGDAGALNKIPNAFTAEISLPSQEFKPSLLEKIKTELTALVKQHADDNLQGFVLTVEQLPQAPQALVLQSQAGAKLMDSILAVPNGVLEQSASYPNNILTSSNLGALKITATQGDYDIVVGSMSRSFSQPSLKKTVTNIQDNLKVAFSGASKIMFKDGGSYPSWVAKSNSQLLARALSLNQYFQKTTPTTVGIETSVFAEKYPAMDIISISPVIRNAHTINEELSMSSTRETVEALQSLLALE